MQVNNRTKQSSYDKEFFLTYIKVSKLIERIIELELFASKIKITKIRT